MARRLCLYCGEETKNKKFCSTRCVGQYRIAHPTAPPNLEHRICENCGTEFLPKMSRQRFCCATCREAETGIGSQYNKREKHPCLACGKETKNAKFCSSKCNGDYQRIHPPQPPPLSRRFCDHCGAEFQPTNAQNRFCCGGCLTAEYNKGHRTIWVRDGFKCIYCGKSSIEDGVKLTLDHITPRDAGGEDIASNLVTACWDCNVSKNASILPDKIYKRVTRMVKCRNKAAGISNTQKITSPGWKLGFKHRKSAG